MKVVKDINEKFRVILASGSPRRKELLHLTGIEFEVWPSDKEEEASSTEPVKYCMSLSRNKAVDVAAQIKTYNDTHPELTAPGDILVIGADTIVAKDGVIMGKPADEADAKRMLAMLSNDTHSVFTGVTFVFVNSKGRAGEYTFCEETKVSFYPLSDEDIEDYTASGDPLDKAGAYGIQSGAAAFVRSIDGDYYNVVGLPVARMLNELKQLMNDNAG